MRFLQASLDLDKGQIRFFLHQSEKPRRVRLNGGRAVIASAGLRRAAAGLSDAPRPPDRGTDADPEHPRSMTA